MPVIRRSPPAIMEFHGLAALALKGLGVKNLWVDKGAWTALNKLDCDLIDRYRGIKEFLRSKRFINLGLKAVWHDEVGKELFIVKRVAALRAAGLDPADAVCPEPSPRTCSGLGFDEV